VTRGRWQTAVALGAAISALFWIDPLFIPLALLGPMVLGAVAGAKGLSWQWPAAVFVVAGLGAVASDWIVNRSDVAFHLVLTFVMTALALGSHALARAAASRRRTAATAAVAD
jgi:hypothetical protein